MFSLKWDFCDQIVKSKEIKRGEPKVKKKQKRTRWNSPTLIVQLNPDLHSYTHYNQYLNHIDIVKASKKPRILCGPVATLWSWPMGRKVPVKCREGAVSHVTFCGREASYISVSC